MIFILTGSRSWNDSSPVYATLDWLCAASAALAPGVMMTVRHGKARRGVDQHVANWQAHRPHLALVDEHPADWAGPCLDGPYGNPPITCPSGHRRKRDDGSDYCPACGNRRNQEMVDPGATACVGLIRARSTGTADCLKRARAAGIPTATISWEELYGVPSTTNLRRRVEARLADQLPRDVLAARH